jgi:predicted kinase
MLNNHVAATSEDNSIESPKLFVLVGIPGSGKSTFIRQKMSADDYVIISTDDVIEKMAAEVGKTYDELWQTRPYKRAKKIADANFADAVKNVKNIIWDQTNITIDKRKTILSKIPEQYYKVAVLFTTPLDVVKDRLKKREKEGKIIPDHVVNDMFKRLQPPTVTEGFDEVVLV